MKACYVVYMEGVYEAEWEITDIKDVYLSEVDAEARVVWLRSISDQYRDSLGYSHVNVLYKKVPFHPNHIGG